MSDSEQEQQPELEPEPAPGRRRRRRHPPPAIPVIGTIEEAEAALLFGIITGNEAAAAVVTELINSESPGEAVTNTLRDLATIAFRRGGVPALEAIISQFVGLYTIFFLYTEFFEKIIFQDKDGQRTDWK